MNVRKPRGEGVEELDGIHGIEQLASWLRIKEGKKKGAVPVEVWVKLEMAWIGLDWWGFWG